MRIPEQYNHTRLLVLDFVRRNRHDALKDALFYAMFMGMWISNSRTIASFWGGWGMAALIMVIAPGPTGLLRDTDPKVLRSLPVSKRSRSLAAWIGHCIPPLFICGAISLPVFLINLAADREVALAAFYFAANVFAVAVSAIWMAGGQTALKRPGSRQPIMGLLPLHSVPSRSSRLRRLFLLFVGLSGFSVLWWVARIVPGAWLLWWTFTEIPPVPAVLVLFGVAAPLFTISFLLRSNLDPELRTWGCDVNTGGSADGVPVILGGKWQDLQYPWKQSLRTGLLLGAILTAATMSGVPLAGGDEAFAGALMVPVMILMPFLVVGRITSKACRQSLRAMRMLPLSAGQLTRMAMVHQLSITLPSVVMLCIGAFFLVLLRGDAVSANILAATALGGQSLILIMLPTVLQQGERASELLVIFVFLNIAFWGIALFEGMGAEWITAVAVLPPLAAIVLPVATVVSFRLLRTAIAKDSRSYQKRTEYLSWPQV